LNYNRSDSASSRAGRYVQQTTGYRAFYPASLQPEPEIRLDSELQTLLSAADRHLARLDGSIWTLPNPDWFVFSYARKEAVLSNQIEGTQSSLDDLLAAEAHVLAAGAPKDYDDSLRYLEAMYHGLERLGALPVSVRLVREIHETVLKTGRGSQRTPGELRRSQNWIGPGEARLDEAIFVPPPPHEVANCLADWERFIHADSSLPILVKIGIAHAQFETIHPFLDGNGRVGRLLIAFLLCEREILTKPVLYLSHYFKQHQQEYYARLQAIRDAGDWEGWLGFFLQGVAEVSRDATLTARRILSMRQEHLALITERLGGAAGNGYRTLEYLYEHPIVSVKQIQQHIGTSYPAANQLIARMVDAGILEEYTGQSRNRAFIYRPYVRLFTEGPAEDA